MNIEQAKSYAKQEAESCGVNQYVFTRPSGEYEVTDSDSYYTDEKQFGHYDPQGEWHSAGAGEEEIDPSDKSQPTYDRDSDPTDSYKLHENIAAVTAAFHGDARLADYVENDQESECERLRMCIEAGELLTRHEPKDYEAANLDWYLVADAVADGLYNNLSPKHAVDAALTSADARMLKDKV